MLRMMSYYIIKMAAKCEVVIFTTEIMREMM